MFKPGRFSVEEIIFLTSECACLCIFLKVNCIYIKTMTHPCLECTQVSPQPEVIATEMLKKKVHFSSATLLFPKICTTSISLEGPFSSPSPSPLPMLLPLTDFPPQIIFSDHSRVLRFPGSI